MCLTLTFEDDEGAAAEVVACFNGLQLSFGMWTNQIHDTLNSKKKGDSAFRHKEFKAAIDFYTQVCHLF